MMIDKENKRERDLIVENKGMKEKKNVKEI